MVKYFYSIRISLSTLATRTQAIQDRIIDKIVSDTDTIDIC